jgi:hypothetical protein
MAGYQWKQVRCPHCSNEWKMKFYHSDEVMRVVCKDYRGGCGAEFESTWENRACSYLHDDGTCYYFCTEQERAACTAFLKDWTPAPEPTRSSEEEWAEAAALKVSGGKFKGKTWAEMYTFDPGHVRGLAATSRSWVVRRRALYTCLAMGDESI